MDATLTPATRRAALESMADEGVDVLVIGGGVVGAGTALEVSRRGLRVGLVEREDFASGASGRSSRELHGGLQYLVRGEVRFVRQLLRERAAVAALAPHLVTVLPYLLPTHGAGERAATAAVLRIYDALAGRSRIAPHRSVTADETGRLTGGLVDRPALLHAEYAVDDARLTLEIVRQAAIRGAFVANHVSVDGFLGNGRVDGVVATDRATGEACEIAAKVIVNATGAWAETVSRTAGGHRVRMSPTKGVHLVLSATDLPISTGLVLPSATGRGRHFCVPWGDLVYAGTTDTPYDGDPAVVEVDEADEGVLLESINAALPVQLGRRDIVASWAGVRPLVDRDGTAAQPSRRPLLVEDPPGLLTVTGGKLTSYRVMARRCADEVTRRAPPSEAPGADVQHLGLQGPLPRALALAEESVRRRALAPDLAVRLVTRFGDRWRDALALIDRDRSLADPLWPGLAVLRVEVAMAFAQEMAITDDDVLVRRTRLATMHRDAAARLRGQLQDLRHPPP